MVTISIGSPSILDEKPIKREKGKSILSVPSEYVVLDLETTGLDAHFDNIIEIACMHINDGEIEIHFTHMLNLLCLNILMAAAIM